MTKPSFRLTRYAAAAAAVLTAVGAGLAGSTSAAAATIRPDSNCNYVATFSNGAGFCFEEIAGWTSSGSGGGNVPGKPGPGQISILLNGGVPPFIETLWCGEANTANLDITQTGTPNAVDFHWACLSGITNSPGGAEHTATFAYQEATLG
jgi:hypothetical protein